MRTEIDPNDTLAGDRWPEPVGGVIRELDQRASDGISVTMLWNAETNRVLICVVEESHGASCEFEVAGCDAADAFHHPFAYAPRDFQHHALAA